MSQMEYFEPHLLDGEHDRPDIGIELEKKNGLKKPMDTSRIRARGTASISRKEVTSLDTTTSTTGSTSVTASSIDASKKSNGGTPAYR